MTGTTVYLNGRFLPLTEARISPLDRGFLFGDGVYEVIPVYSRRPFRLAEHLARFRRSLAGIGLPEPLTGEQWQHIVYALIDKAEWLDQGIYLHVTRGADSTRDHPFPQKCVPTVFAMAMPLPTPSEALRAAGVPAMTASDSRWAHCDLKTTALLANVLLRQRSVEAGCAETILLRDGFLTEASAASVLLIRSDTLLAPPAGDFVLPGVTSEVVFELAQQNGLRTALRPLSEQELRTADEIWLTSSTKEVLAVTSLDGQPVGTGCPGPWNRKMSSWYQEFKDRVMRHG